MKKKTREQFIKEAQEKHGDKYDYSNVEYINPSNKVNIKCIKHNIIFKQLPFGHLKSSGCKECIVDIKRKKKLERYSAEFIKKAQEIHKDDKGIPLYDYSHMIYIKAREPIKISCKFHGIFEQTPDNHKRNHGCPKCAISTRLINKNFQIRNKEDFIKKAEELHKDKKGVPLYDYTNVDYINTEKKVNIICKLHGKFEITPHQHITSKRICKKCSIRIDSYEKFIKKAQEIHKDDKGIPLYDYSKTVWISSFNKVIIICKKHKEFEQLPSNHCNGDGCKRCSIELNAKNKTMSKKDFIKKAQELHKDEHEVPLYDYSKIKYINSRIDITINCIIHGDFEQMPNSHLQGQGCPKCGFISRVKKITHTLEDFTQKAKIIHKDKYDYSKVKYVNSKTKVIIICKEHGEFKQTPHTHLTRDGCPRCSNAKQYSKVSIEWLNFISKKENIIIQHAENEAEFKIPNSRYSADGYCKETNTIYEFHGCFWHGCKNCFEDRDEINKVTKKTMEQLYIKTEKKKKWCIEYGYNYKEIWECEWYDLEDDLEDEIELIFED